MNGTYLTVGRNHEIVSPTFQPRKIDFPLELRVATNGRHVGNVRAWLDSRTIRLKVGKSTSLTGPSLGEVLKLWSRLCIRVGGYRFGLAIDTKQIRDDNVISELRNDGFEVIKSGILLRSPTPFTLPIHKKKDSMEEVYQDPFCVPWNFVPREQEVLDALLQNIRAQHSSKQRSARVLDLGCGFGKNSTFLEAVGLDVYGLDVSTTAITRCQGLVAHPERYKAGNAVSLPWADRYFDFVLDVGCLHCMPPTDRPLALREIHRVLRPQGLLVSRMFKPRPRKWITEQPFYTEEFGIELQEVREMTEGYFEIKIDEKPNYIILFGRVL